MERLKKTAKRKAQSANFKIILHFASCNGRKSAWLYLAIVFIATLAAAPQKKGPQEAKISITTRLDKTAIWVGDALNYTIQVVHDRDLEFVMDNLKKDGLSLAPFIVREITFRQGEWEPDKRLLEINFVLSSYEIGRSELTIPPLNLYYFKRGVGTGRKEELAEVVKVPAAKVGLRSTLIGGQLKLRDLKPVPDRDMRRLLAALILGLAGLGFLSVRLLRWARSRLHRERPAKRRMRRQARMRFVRERLARLREIDNESPQDPIRFYTEVSQFLRDYLALSLDIEAAGLTPEEIDAALKKAKVNGDLTQQIKAVLEQCDTIRYGKKSLHPEGSLRSKMLNSVEGIVRAPQS